MKLDDKVYDVLKWIGLIAIPAVGVFYTAIASAWGLPYADAVSKTCNALGVLIGALIGASSASYSTSKSIDEAEIYVEDEIVDAYDEEA